MERIATQIRKCDVVLHLKKKKNIILMDMATNWEPQFWRLLTNQQFQLLTENTLIH